QSGEWFTVKPTENVHLSVFLLELGYVSEASQLISEKAMQGWVTFKLNGEHFTDVQYALAKGYNEYLVSLYKTYPEKINSQFTVGLNGAKATVLGLLATKQYTNLDNYELILISLLRAGADPLIPASKDVPAHVLAATSENYSFIKILKGNSGQLITESRVLSNPILTNVELIEEQAIIDAFLELIAEQAKPFKLSSLHDEWIDMILKGYNNMADLLLEEMQKAPDFELSMKSRRGVSGLQACSLSTVYGGNVSYANRLINIGGAGLKKVLTLPSGNDSSVNANLIELALPSDNFRIVALLIQSGVPFVSNSGDKNLLIIEQALRHKAYKSASVIKAAIDSLMSTKRVKNGS
ncbi:MAG: hypothetical protein HAW67_07840, partial [Endozoicomonadaceae bacterium]|nr:hypothetical protein [Endozoicomonadaceae bacterium]